MTDVPKGEEYITPKKKSLLKGIASGLGKGASWLGKEAEVVGTRAGEEFKKKKYRKVFGKGYGRIIGESAGYVEKPLSHYDSTELLTMLGNADKLPTTTAKDKAEVRAFKSKVRKILRQRGEFARRTSKDEAIISKLKRIS